MNAIETHLSQTLNFQFIHEHLFTSGQPTAEQLQQIKRVWRKHGHQSCAQ